MFIIGRVYQSRGAAAGNSRTFRPLIEPARRLPRFVGNSRPALRPANVGSYGQVPGESQTGGIAKVVAATSAKGVCSLPPTKAVSRQT
jgi:hypothetical protein